MLILVPFNQSISSFCRHIQAQNPGHTAGHAPGQTSGHAPRQVASQTSGYASRQAPTLASGQNTGNNSSHTPGQASNHTPGHTSKYVSDKLICMSYQQWMRLISHSRLFRKKIAPLANRSGHLVYKFFWLLL